MGALIDGKWEDVWYDTASTKGKFVRSVAAFRNFVTADGSPGPTGKGGFKAEPGRYHLYISHACPWAHRTMIFRSLKKLENVISYSVVDYLMAEEGWTFYGTTGSSGDEILGKKRLYEIYQAADPTYSGRVTVPVLWDKQQQTIVSNESSEIIRMLNTAFNEFTDVKTDFYPENLQAEIDEINDFVYHRVNNGVYKAGFATTQEAYEEAVLELFAALDVLETRLGSNRYLVGETLTEADWRLFTTLIRFDAVYVGHFKCNLKHLADYPNLFNYTKELYQMEGVAPTVDMGHIKGHYYASHKQINPTGIIPLGQELDFMEAHNREEL